MLGQRENQIEINHAMNFLNEFAEKYTNGNLDFAMESLQFNRDCLTQEEKKHLQVLLSCR